MSQGGSPRVSILLPTHNRADVLPFAIRSVLAQSVADFELLVVGDGCTDDTATVVQGFGDARIRWFDLPKGPGFGYGNRNVALRQARGEIVAYLAHDDLWFPDHLARLLAPLERPGIEFTYSLQLRVSVTGRIEPMVFDMNDTAVWRAWLDKHAGYIAIVDVAHRRECYEKYGYWNEHLRQRGDYELWMRFAHREPVPNFEYLIVPTSLRFVADWRRRPESRSRRLWRSLRVREGASLPALQLDLAGSASEQEAAWKAIERAPEEWVAGVRRAVQADLNRRGAYRFALSDYLEAGRRTLEQARLHKRDWVEFALPGAEANFQAPAQAGGPAQGENSR